MSSNLFKRFEVLVSTGLPGLYRVLAFFPVEQIFSLSELGQAASSMSGAQIASYATAVGWLTLVLVRLPAASTKQEAVNTFYRFVWMSFLTSLAVSLLTFCASKLGVLPFELSGFLWQLWGWTAYQMGRHFFVAFRRYRATIGLDGLLIFLTTLALKASHYLGWSPATALGLALVAVAFVMFVLIGVPSSLAGVMEFEGKGLEFGFTNLLSGGISLVIVPIAEKMCGASFAGVLSLLTSITAIGALLPRAVSLSQLPELAKLKGQGKKIDEVIRVMKREITASNFATFLISLGLISFVVIWKVSGESQRLYVFLTGFMLSMQCMVGVMGAVNSNIMMIFERGKQSLSINIKSTFIFILIASGSFWFGGRGGFWGVMLGVVLGILIKNIMIKTEVNRVVDIYSRGIS